MEKGELIGRGGTAEVFAWGGDRVLKLFTPEYAYSADSEFEATRAVHAAGAPAPRVFERIQVEGREGIVFQRVSGPTLLEAPPDLQGDLAVRLAEVHAQVHACRSADLPTRGELVKRNLDRIPEAARADFEEREARVPRGDAVCHALFHPGHVLLSPMGPVVIDWPDAFSGPPALDVARTWTFLRFLGVSSPAEGKARAAFAARYRRAYLEETVVRDEDVARCQPLVALTLLHYTPDHPEREALTRLAALG